MPVFAAAHRPELRITRLLVQEAAGRRPTPVARNAYADYRGFDVIEPILRIQTAQGLEGISRAPKGNPAALRAFLHPMLGQDAAAFFDWSGDHILGAAPAYRMLLEQLHGVDIALIDLLGRAMGRPASALLGSKVRQQILVYDSSVYMEDLLTPQQLESIAYLQGKRVPADPVQLPAIKAAWVLANRPEGFRALKIKLGRSMWMPPEQAVQRDIAVTTAVRAAVGPDIRLMVDANKDYRPRPAAAIDYAHAVADTRPYMLEEMFPEEQTADLIALKQALRRSGNRAKLACGESHPGGVPQDVYRQRVVLSNGRTEPLVDIEQADMNAHGFLYIREKAAMERPFGMTVAPHNFATKMGFYAMVHLAMATPNWEMCEVDDAQFPALRAEGVEVKNGMARLTGRPGLGVELVADQLRKPIVDLTS